MFRLHPVWTNINLLMFVDSLFLSFRLGKSAPVSPDDSGENTTERVALRCLEELFVPENGV